MRKMISAVLSAVLLLCASTPVWAAENSMDNFKSVQKYEIPFSDVPSSNWAASSVKTCYEYRLMNGVSATDFRPKGSLTVAEALAMACRVHQIYSEGRCTLENGSPLWYQPYIDYALSQGIIASSDFKDYTATITRAEMAYIFYNALPQSCFAKINKIKDIPDVDDRVANAYEITALYEAGVLTGSNSYGTFYPNRNITRAEVSAIIARVAVPSLRQKFELESSSNGNDPQEKELSAGEVYNRCAPGVVYIAVYDASGRILRTGSGFFIDSSGTLVTNYHVVEGGASAKITTMDNQVYDVAGVYDFDESADIVLLKVKGSGFSSLQISTWKVSAGDTVYAIGSPLGLSNTISSGIVSNASRVYKGITYFQVTAPISSGSSGGALIDSKGRVIGVTTGEFYSNSNMGQNLNIALPLSYLSGLERSSVTPMEQALAGSKATIQAAASSITLSVGKTASVEIAHTSKNAVSLISRVSDPNIAVCSWGKWTSHETTSLTVKGLKRGTTTITVGFNEGETSDATALITVNVV